MSPERPVELFLTRVEAEVLLEGIEGIIWRLDTDPTFPASPKEKQRQIHLSDLQRYLKEALREELGE